MKILVTGAAGELGAALVARFRDRADVVGLTRAGLDIHDARAVDALVAREQPGAIVNCAAYNDVDGAEDHAHDALRTNAIAVRSLAAAAGRNGATFVHYSTDFVFSGEADGLYGEEDEPAPQSSYGMSKLLGEYFAAGAPRHYVLRVASLFGGTRRASRIDRIAEALGRSERTRVFVDRTVTPSYSPDVIEATWTLLSGGAPAGVYHCVSTGKTTWAALALQIAADLGADASLVVPVRVADVASRAPRPQYPALSNARLRRLGISLPAWESSVRRHLEAAGYCSIAPHERAR